MECCMVQESFYKINPQPRPEGPDYRLACQMLLLGIERAEQELVQIRARVEYMLRVQTENDDSRT